MCIDRMRLDLMKPTVQLYEIDLGRFQNRPALNQGTICKSHTAMLLQGWCSLSKSVPICVCVCV